MPPSTLYYTLSPSRTRLPSLDVVGAIVQACASPGTREDWIDAWRALRLRQFEQENPGPQEDQEADVLAPETWRWFCSSVSTAVVRDQRPHPWPRRD